MNYVKTFEGWFKRSIKKAPTPIETTPVAEVDEAGEILNKMNILGLNFVKVYSPNKYRNIYISPVDIKVKIEGYIDSKLNINTDTNSMALALSINFKEGSIIGNFVGRVGWRGLDNNNSDLIPPSVSFTKKDNMVSIVISDTFMIKKSISDLEELITNKVKDILNIDIDKLEKNIIIINSQIDEIKRISSEYQKRLLKLKERLLKLKEQEDVISDYLISLEEMSTKHSKEFKDDKIILYYNIKGIRIKHSKIIISPSSYAPSSTIEINDVILTIISEIKTFIKRIENKIEGVIIEYKFSDDIVCIELSIENEIENSEDLSNLRAGINPEVYL